MTQKCSKKLVLLKTFYYRVRTQDNKYNGNRTEFITNPLTSSASSIYRITDKKFNPVENEFFVGNKIIITVNNTISGITKQTSQDYIMIKTKYGFISANTFYFDNGSSFHPHTTIPIVDFPVTAASGDLKNAVQVTIEYDNDGTRWSNGVIFARRIHVYGYK